MAKILFQMPNLTPDRLSKLTMIRFSRGWNRQVFKEDKQNTNLKGKNRKAFQRVEK